MNETKEVEKKQKEVETKIVEQEKEIVSIPFISEETEFDGNFIEKLEKNIESYRKIITIALKLTNEQDWTNQNGKPYLDCSGAEKIANPFGVQVKKQRKEKRIEEDKKGQYYIWEYTATFSSTKLGREMEISGFASSRDKFFAKVTKWINGKPQTELKPMEEVDQVRIMQKAQTNMMVNGIKRIIGLRNLTWEQLGEAGLKKEKFVSIQYQEGKEKTKSFTEVSQQTQEKKKLFS